MSKFTLIILNLEFIFYIDTILFCCRRNIEQTLEKYRKEKDVLLKKARAEAESQKKTELEKTKRELEAFNKGAIDSLKQQLDTELEMKRKDLQSQQDKVSKIVLIFYFRKVTQANNE